MIECLPIFVTVTANSSQTGTRVEKVFEVIARSARIILNCAFSLQCTKWVWQNFCRCTKACLTNTLTSDTGQHLLEFHDFPLSVYSQDFVHMTVKVAYCTSTGVHCRESYIVLSYFSRTLNLDRPYIST